MTLGDRIAAWAYAWGHDALVGRFPPYQALLDEVAAYVAIAAAGKVPESVRVLDIACGTGTLARRLARDGYRVVGGDSIPALAQVAQARSGTGPYPVFLYHDPVIYSTRGAADVVVSLHTYYWHPDPVALLAACWKSLRVGGYAILLTYDRPMQVRLIFREVWRRQGARAAIRALCWLVPTAAFETFRTHARRYVSRDKFAWAVRDAGFTILGVRSTFLASATTLVWARRS